MTASIILLVLAAMELGIYLAKHGEYKTGTYNFWIGLLSVAIYLVLYYYAGVFDNFPDVVCIILFLWIFIFGLCY